MNLENNLNNLNRDEFIKKNKTVGFYPKKFYFFFMVVYKKYQIFVYSF